MIEAPLQSPKPEDEVHISSILIHFHPQEKARLLEYFEPRVDCELHLDHADLGKLIVVLETPSYAEIKSLMRELETVKGVLSVAMIYHHTETESDLDEEIL